MVETWCYIKQHPFWLCISHNNTNLESSHHTPWMGVPIWSWEKGTPAAHTKYANLSLIQQSNGGGGGGGGGPGTDFTTWGHLGTFRFEWRWTSFTSTTVVFFPSDVITIVLGSWLYGAPNVNFLLNAIIYIQLII